MGCGACSKRFAGVDSQDGSSICQTSAQSRLNCSGTVTRCPHCDARYCNYHFQPGTAAARMTGGHVCSALTDLLVPDNAKKVASNIEDGSILFCQGPILQSPGEGKLMLGRHCWVQIRFPEIEMEQMHPGDRVRVLSTFMSSSDPPVEHTKDMLGTVVKFEDGWAYIDFNLDSGKQWVKPENLDKLAVVKFADPINFEAYGMHMGDLKTHVGVRSHVGVRLLMGKTTHTFDQMSKMLEDFKKEHPRYYLTSVDCQTWTKHCLLNLGIEQNCIPAMDAEDLPPPPPPRPSRNPRN